MNSIEVHKLTKKFGSFVSVDNISFSVKKSEIFGFLGSNGAGKSTTIRMLCGILAPTSGDAFINGISINERSDEVKKSIGYMSQKFSLYDDLTVKENINFFGGAYGINKQDIESRSKWILKTADLEGKEDIMTKDLPGGIKQRLALGVSLIHNPEIVFLDEPTSGVDPLARRIFWDLINELSSEGKTIFVTTHYLEEAEYCSNIVLLDAGKIVATGNPTNLKSKYIEDDIWEISIKSGFKLDDLGKTPLIKGINKFGNNYHISTARGFNEGDILNELNKHGCKVMRINKIVPTLEDVFIKLVG